jgi:hypothetical protein
LKASNQIPWDAKSEIAALVNSGEIYAHSMDVRNDARKKLHKLLGALESTYQQIATMEFFNLVHEGDWELQYCNAFPFSNEFAIYQIIQTNATKGAITNQIKCKEGSSLDVSASYSLTESGSMSITLLEHILRLEGTSAENAEVLLESIQGNIPFEFFDPDKLFFSSSYVDTELRITRIDNGLKGRNLICLFKKCT